MNRYSSNITKERYSAEQSRVRYAQTTGEKIKRGAKAFLGVAKSDDYSPSEIQEFGKRYISDKNNGKRGIATAGIVGALAVCGYLNSDLRKDVRDFAESIEEVKLVGKYLKSVPLFPGNNEGRYLGMFSREFKEAYENAKPSNLQTVMTGSRGALDSGGKASGKVVERKPGLIEGFAELVGMAQASPRKLLGKDDTNRKGREYAKNYDKATDNFISGINKLIQYEGEIRKLEQRMISQERSGGAGKVDRKTLNEYVDNCAQKITLWGYLKSLPQTATSDSLTAREISEGMNNARYRQIIVQKPAELGLKKPQMDLVNQVDVGAMLLVGAVGAYVGKKGYGMAVKAYRAGRVTKNVIDSVVGKSLSVIRDKIKRKV